MGFYLVLLWFARVLLGFTGFYRVLPGFTEFHRVSPGFTGFYYDGIESHHLPLVTGFFYSNCNVCFFLFFFQEPIKAPSECVRVFDSGAEMLDGQMA